jgi:2-C-methyl-D-erythritol 4-phosphate cytidylyltransferase
MVRAAAIIVAGGSGKRMPGDLSKQYLLLDNIPILAHTLKKFDSVVSLGGIILAVPSDDVDYVRNSIVDRYHITKVDNIIAGGKERQDSVKNGLHLASDDNDIVIIHDGVRPFVSQNLIDSVIEKAMETGAAVTGIPVKDTVKKVDKGTIITTLKREDLWLAQTPQAFRTDIIKKAYEKAYEDGFYGTDDAAVVERMGIPVEMIQGSCDNIKITVPEDLVLGEFLLRKE